ncbi:MAG: hypothetical protein DYG99_13790 [Bacteroidetes bacterium CHB5]|nr:hypothetical protein [Bacteroidetes bacterium CHB5]
MKNTAKHFALFSILLTATLIFTPAFSAQNSDLKDFKIEIQRTDNGLKLIGQTGTAFRELSFSLRDNVQQGIDEFGMTIPETKKNTKDDNLADFEFTIEKVGKEYVLVGKRGTAWTRLSFTFSVDNKVTIDQNGVTVK